jgi:hypothetical protein
MFHMEHVAILKDPFFSLILSGEKTIESRWYKTRRVPYNNIRRREVVYLKKSGCKVSAKARASHVLFFDSLDEKKIAAIIDKYGDKIKLQQKDVTKYAGLRYCTLIFLEDVQKIEPFAIDKKGFGNMSAWISVSSIKEIKK